MDVLVVNVLLDGTIHRHYEARDSFPPANEDEREQLKFEDREALRMRRSEYED